MNTAEAPQWLPKVLVPFFTLSYPTARPQSPDAYPHSNYYGTGYLDFYFVLTWILVLGILRECLRLGLLEPFARHYLYRKDMTEAQRKKALVANGSANGHMIANGSPANIRPPVLSSKNIVNQRPKGMSKVTWKRERSAIRFAEQGWQFAYYIVYWPLGMYVHWGFPSAPFNLDNLWINYPHIPLAGPVKFYYLTQLGFWFHQVLLLNAEAWRKDHFQMMSHHIVTICLVTASYWFNFTRVGVLIMVLMDWCDIFLACMKMCRYLRLPDLVINMFFAIFGISWVITRHVLFSFVIYSAYKRVPTLLLFVWEPERGYYLTHNAYIGFIALMITLQLILSAWLFTICSIVWNVIKGQPPEDSRSDEESGVDSEELKEQ